MIFFFFDNLRAFVSRLASPFGQPTQVCTQFQFNLRLLVSTCVIVWPEHKAWQRNEKATSQSVIHGTRTILIPDKKSVGK